MATKASICRGTVALHYYKPKVNFLVLGTKGFKSNVAYIGQTLLTQHRRIDNCVKERTACCVVLQIMQ
jgi:hypothetical protein